MTHVLSFAAGVLAAVLAVTVGLAVRAERRGDYARWVETRKDGR